MDATEFEPDSSRLASQPSLIDTLFSRSLGRNESFDFQHVAVRHTVTLILVRDDFQQRLEIVELDSWKLCPFRFRLETRPQLPFAGMTSGGHQTRLALFGFLTPFVFLHASTNSEFVRQVFNSQLDHVFLVSESKMKIVLK